MVRWSGREGVHGIEVIPRAIRVLVRIAGYAKDLLARVGSQIGV